MRNRLPGRNGLPKIVQDQEMCCPCLWPPNLTDSHTEPYVRVGQFLFDLITWSNFTSPLRITYRTSPSSMYVTEFNSLLNHETKSTRWSLPVIQNLKQLQAQASKWPFWTDGLGMKHYLFQNWLLGWVILWTTRVMHLILRYLLTNRHDSDKHFYS
jgi:hypothetical protein